MSPGRSETNTNSQVLLCPPLTPLRPPDSCSPCLSRTGPGLGPGRPHCSPERPGTSEDPSNIHPAFQVSRRGGPGSLTPTSSGHCTLSPVGIEQLGSQECDKGVFQAHSYDRRFPWFPSSRAMLQLPEDQEIHLVLKNRTCTSSG